MHVRPALTILLKEHPDLPIRQIEELGGGVGVEGKWDWGRVKVHLVPSIAGRHEGWVDVIQWVFFFYEDWW